MTVTNKLTIHLDENRILRPVDAVQGDTGRMIVASLYSGGATWQVPEGATIAIRYRRSDGSGDSYDILPDGTRAWSISGNTVTVTLTRAVLGLPGLTKLQIAVLKGEAIISTFTIPIYVDADPAVNAGELPPVGSSLAGTFDVVFDGTEGDYSVFPSSLWAADHAYANKKNLRCIVPVSGGTAVVPLVHVTIEDNSKTYLFGGSTALLESAEGGRTVSVMIRTDNSGAEYDIKITPLMSNGVFIVNAIPDGQGYDTDITYDGVLAMYNEGVRPIECRIEYGGIKYALPLRGVEDGQLVYSGIAGERTLTVYHNNTEGVTVVSSNLSTGGGSEVYRVVVTHGEDGAYTADKTLGEVLGAHEANKAVQCVIELNGSTFVLPLCNLFADEDNMYLVYGGSAGNQSLAVFHTITENITVSSEVLARKSYVDESIANIPTGADNVFRISQTTTKAASSVTLELPCNWEEILTFNIHGSLGALVETMALYSHIANTSYKQWGNITAGSNVGFNLYGNRFYDKAFSVGFSPSNLDTNAARPALGTVTMNGKEGDNTISIYSNTSGVDFPAGTIFEVWGVYTK